jgi:hypothetical protein
MFMLYFGMAWACLFRLWVCQYLVVEQCEFHAFSFEVQRAKYKHLKSKDMRKIKVYIAASLDGYIA